MNDDILIALSLYKIDRGLNLSQISVTGADLQTHLRGSGLAYKCLVINVS